MLAKFERRAFTEGCKVWLGKYRSLHNIPHWHYEHELVCWMASSTAWKPVCVSSVRRKAPTLSPAALTAV